MMRSARVLTVLALATSIFAANRASAQSAQGTPARPSSAAATAQQSPADGRLRAGLIIRPETVSVADPFLLRVAVEVPNGARIEWPSIEDSTANVSQRAPVRVGDTVINGVRRELAEYVLAAWDTGTVALGMNDALVHVGTTTIRVALNGTIYVKSVLPADTSLQKPKPAKALFPRIIPWWERWWPALLVLLALGILWWLVRRRKRRVVAGDVAPKLDLYARAVQDFERLDRLALADSGERGRFVALAVEVMRTYLAGRVPAAKMSHTTSELISSVREDLRVPVTRLAPLLGESDAIKFARYRIDTARARQLASEARGIVDDIERAEQERLAAIAAEQLRRQQLERKAKESDEDEARRRSRKGAA